MSLRNYSTLGLLVVLLAVPTFAGPICPSGVVGYWPLDGSATEEVNGFPGTLFGTAGYGPGVLGGALELDGDFPASYLDAGTHSELSSFGGSQATVAAWVRRELDGPAGDLDGGIFSVRTLCDFPPPPGDTGLGNLQLYGSPGLFFSIWGNETISGDGFSKPDTSFFTFASVPEGVWTHVAASYNGASVGYYVNGVLVHDAPASGPGGPISDDLRNTQLGWDSCGSYWTGGIDDLAVWSVALNGTEVMDLYQNGLIGEPVCAHDDDGDGVAHRDDLCPDTVFTALVDGCDCAQILDFKPGKTKGQYPDNCSAGTIADFAARRGWANNIPLP